MAWSSKTSENATEVPSQTFIVDIEQKAVDEAHVQNTTVQSYSWKGVTVTVKDRQTKQPKAILSGIDGSVKAGR